MSWFDEQIKQRKQQDNELFADALEEIACSVTGMKKDADKLDISKDAIASILKYYGYKSKNEVPTEITGFEDQLTYMCRPFGVMFRKIRLTGEWWKDCVGEVLAFRSDNGSAVVLIPDGFGYHFLSDGKKERVSKHNCELISESAYCFYKPFPSRRMNAADLLKYALFSQSAKDVVVILVFMGIATLVGLLTPKLSNFLYGTVVESGSNQLLFSTVFFFICVSISQTLFTQFHTMFSSVISMKMNLSVQSAAMMRILSLPPDFFRKYSSGELSQRSMMLSNLADTLMTALLTVGLSSLFSLAYISSIFEFAPGLVVPSLIIILVTMAFSIVSTLTQQRISKETMEIASKCSGMTYAMLSGIKKIRMAGAEKRAFARWAKLFSKQSARTYNPPAILKFNNVILLAITSVGTVTMYFFAIKTGVDLAEYNAFNTAYGLFFGAFSALSGLAGTLATVKPVLGIVKPILETQPEISEEKEIVSRIGGKIEFNNISFSYDGASPLIIDDMTFTVLPNQYIGIVGKTGCGKSTLIRLLLGFEKAQKGTVYFDGKDINSLDLKSLRRSIGVVMQDSRLFQGNIFSNITISAPWLTLDEAWEAAEIAGIADDIAAMPMGMHTMISEGSGGISGGQRQRLAIARAIAPKPKILIFDEATSALDNITQKKVSEALDKLNCTRIVIAHRLSTIKHCDRILYLGSGKILEDGTYDELIAKNGLFAELVERQRLDK